MVRKVKVTYIDGKVEEPYVNNAIEADDGRLILCGIQTPSGTSNKTIAAGQWRTIERGNY